MAKSNLVTVIINGKSFGGWEQVSITRSLENAAAGFQLAVSERFPGQSQPLRIIPGDGCQVKIGDDLVITGYVDKVNPSHDKGAHTIMVSGRSKTADLVDCAVEPPFSTISNLTILQIADKLAKPYGVDIVDALKGETEPIESVDLNVGDTVFAVISKLAAMKACLVTDDEKGRLLITRAGTAKATTALRSGKDGNILSGSGNFDVSQRYRNYTCDGQGKGNDLNYGAAVSEVVATVEDQGVKRNRTLYIRAEGTADLKKVQDRARWEASSRIGKSISLTLNVQGWRQGNGDLWKVNHLALVKDPLLTVDGEFLISSITYSLNASGTITSMTLTPKSAYELEPTQSKPTKDVGTYRQLVESGKLQ